MSHYANYIKERENYEIVENENGFATFAQVGDSVYLRDIYIVPEKRKTGAGKQFLQHVESWAKEKGISKILGTVCPSANGSTVSMKAILAVGFELMSSEKDMVYFIKNI